MNDEERAAVGTCYKQKGHAYHRGSSFGHHAKPQPSQINFENRLSIDLLKKQQKCSGQLVLEDEGHVIGRCALPVNLVKTMQTSALIWLEAPQQERIERVLKDYVIDLQKEYVNISGEEQGKLAFAEHLLTSLNRITKRLGNERYQQLEQLMQAALNKNCLAIHREWISLLLESYYDPMYRYQRQKKSSQIIFSGTAEAVAEFLQQQPTHH